MAGAGQAEQQVNGKEIRNGCGTEGATDGQASEALLLRINSMGR
jgi:hypothetical protein